MTYRFYDEFYRSNHLILKPEFEAATTDQILPMVKNNLGLGFFPKKWQDNPLLLARSVRYTYMKPFRIVKYFLWRIKNAPYRLRQKR